MNKLLFISMLIVTMSLSYDKIPITLDEFEKWESNKNINPRTNKEISHHGKIYKYLETINIKD